MSPIEDDIAETFGCFTDGFDSNSHTPDLSFRRIDLTTIHPILHLSFIPPFAFDPYPFCPAAVPYRTFVVNSQRRTNRHHRFVVSFCCIAVNLPLYPRFWSSVLSLRSDPGRERETLRISLSSNVGIRSADDF
jgi:hypothetical protein